jgi:hypothetical protein
MVTWAWLQGCEGVKASFLQGLVQPLRSLVMDYSIRPQIQKALHFHVRFSFLKPNLHALIWIHMYLPFYLSPLLSIAASVSLS